MIGKDGMKLLEFVGKGSGSRTYWGPVTGQRYVFGNNDRDRIKYVDADDADEFLQLWKGHGPEFSIYVAPKKETIKVDAEEVARIKGGEIDATVSAAKLADEQGVDLAFVEGSGKDGRITKRDVEAAVGVLA